MQTLKKTPQQKYTFLAQILLAYTWLVILWGAWVRISHSGDGCGDHWPLCHGAVLPDASQPSTFVEFSHRLSTGLFGIFVFALSAWAFRIFPKKHPVRIAALASVFFTLTEALIGAKIVLSGLVAENASVGRALYMALHLVNSLLLTASIALLVRFSSSSGQQFSSWWSARPKASLMALLGVLVLGITGAFAALSTTLFPSATIAESVEKDFASGSHFLLQIRVLHPILACLLGYALFVWAKRLFLFYQGKNQTRRFVYVLVATIAVGTTTLLSLSPTWLKLAHLFMAHLTWVTLVWLVFTPIEPTALAHASGDPTPA